MLCLADRQFFGHALWQRATASGADLLWRGKHNLRLPREAVLADGSYLTTIYPSDKDRRHRTGGIPVRVVEYQLTGVAEAEPLYRLLTTLLDPAQAPAAELAALYHERWEIEGALAELKTQLLLMRAVHRALHGRVTRLTVLIALGTHGAMSEEALAAHLGYAGRGLARPIPAPSWSTTSGGRPETFADLGTIPAARIDELSEGRMSLDVAGAAQPRGRRPRHRARGRSGAAARGGRASPAATSTSSPASPARRSSTSRTGWAR